MLVGKREYGTWSDGSSIYKDSKGYYIVTVKTPYKKYLKKWNPDKGSPQLFHKEKMG